MSADQFAEARRRMVGVAEGLAVVSRDASEFVAAAVPVLDPWTRRHPPGDGQAVLLDEPARADLLASISATP